MEAMASRLPVIASRVAGVPELVEDGVSGFTVPPGDVATLADRLDRLLADPGLRARMGAAGRARVEDAFDQAKEAAWLLDILAGRAEAGRLRPEREVPDAASRA
jgi:glycosyltransferase involved in cell wall biosynthesis